MCRLFGMSGGSAPVKATFWLLEAPDSLARQSRREPDGTGLGSFSADGEPIVAKQPLAAYEDQRFASEARELESRAFVAHVRYASTGDLTMQNTHPFEQQGRLFAHNGVIGDLQELERELGDAMSLVGGQTDSERFFALITRETERAAGDLAEGITRAVRWISQNLPVFALNFVLITQSELWAFRYPDVHELHLLERRSGGPNGARQLDHASARGSVRVRSGALSHRPAVVIATERMDEDAEWRELRSGELLRVDEQLRTSSSSIIEAPPAHPLTLSDLDQRAAASQGPEPKP